MSNFNNSGAAVEEISSYICQEYCKYRNCVSMEQKCKECKVPALVIRGMGAGLEDFQKDLVEFAERNWANSHVEMLKGAIQCVLEGKEVYAPIEEE